MAIYLTSDWHLGHRNICKFENNGIKLRPWNNINEHDDQIIENYLNTVTDNDTCIFLGDVAFEESSLERVMTLPGSKILILGNHDILNINSYIRVFDNIISAYYLDNYLLTHYPIHPDSITRYSGNIHGHLHNREVNINNSVDIRYYNVSVENTDFKPIEFTEVIRLMNKRKDLIRCSITS